MTYYQTSLKDGIITFLPCSSPLIVENPNYKKYQDLLSEGYFGYKVVQRL